MFGYKPKKKPKSFRPRPVKGVSFLAAVRQRLSSKPAAKKLASKSGRRNSQRDQDSLQKAHDYLIEAGAVCPVAVNKDEDGNYRWWLQSSNAFEDKDKEVVSAKSQHADTDRMWADNDFGTLDFWHLHPDVIADKFRKDPQTIKGLPPTVVTNGIILGDCDFSVMHGRTRIESGTFRSKEIGAWASRNASDLGVSLSFYHPADEPDRDGVYHNIRTFSRALLPRGKESNLFTRMFVRKEKEVATLKEKLTKFFQMGGQSFIPRAAEDAEYYADNRGVRYKEFDNSEYVTAGALKEAIEDIMAEKAGDDTWSFNDLPENAKKAAFANMDREGGKKPAKKKSVSKKKEYATAWAFKEAIDEILAEKDDTWSFDDLPENAKRAAFANMGKAGGGGKKPPARKRGGQGKASQAASTKRIQKSRSIKEMLEDILSEKAGDDTWSFNDLPENSKRAAFANMDRDGGKKPAKKKVAKKKEVSDDDILTMGALKEMLDAVLSEKAFPGMPTRVDDTENPEDEDEEAMGAADAPEDEAPDEVEIPEDEAPEEVEEEVEMPEDTAGEGDMGASEIVGEMSADDFITMLSDALRPLIQAISDGAHVQGKEARHNFAGIVEATKAVQSHNTGTMRNLGDRLARLEGHQPRAVKETFRPTQSRSVGENHPSMQRIKEQDNGGNAVETLVNFIAPGTA